MPCHGHGALRSRAAGTGKSDIASQGEPPHNETERGSRKHFAEAWRIVSAIVGRFGDENVLRSSGLADAAHEAQVQYLNKTRAVRCDDVINVDGTAPVSGSSGIRCLFRRVIQNRTGRASFTLSLGGFREILWFM